MKESQEIKQLKELRQFVNMSKKSFFEALTDCIIIIIDSREKKIDHIKSVFDQYKISYVIRKLNFGDYSFYIDHKKLSEILNIKIETDINFTNNISVERKQNFDELILNFTQKRQQFEDEFIRADKEGSEFRIIVEQKYKTLLLGSLRSKVNRKAIVASIFVFENSYNSFFVYMDKDVTACYIFNYFKYYLYNKI